MTEEQLEAAKLAYSRLKMAQSRITYINRYPAEQDDIAGPPKAMLDKHQAEYKKWAENELAKAEKAFKAI